MRTKMMICAIALMALMVFPSVSEATCNLPTGTIVVQAGSGWSGWYSVSNLAYGTYYLDIETLPGGDFGLLSLNMQAFPGFVQGGTNGFIGSSANIFISFFPSSSAQAGDTTQVRARVYNVLGQTICNQTFTVQIPAFPAPTGFSATYDGEDICYYWNAVPGATRYNFYTSQGLYRTPTNPVYCRELKPKYINWSFQVSAYSNVLGEGEKSAWVSYCTINPSSSYC